ncbi:uncharacterized protein, partial [Patagioenas fasciata]
QPAPGAAARPWRFVPSCRRSAAATGGSCGCSGCGGGRGARGCGPAGRGRAVAVLPPGGRRVAPGRQWGGPAGRPRSSAVENPPHTALGPRSPPVPSWPPCARPLHADLSWLPPAAVSSGPQLPFLFDGEHLTVLCMAKTMRTLDRKSLPSAAFLSPLGSDNSPGIATAAPTAPVSRQQHRRPQYRDSSTDGPGIATAAPTAPVSRRAAVMELVLRRQHRRP